MISSLLIANRGEIACRIVRTARALGIRTIAVHSDADAGALHVREADEAVRIGPAPAAESYLVGERIIAAAKEAKAEAIHPGYGFLAENADFAQSVIDAGLVWVGPGPDSIRAMGLKDAAKALMAKAGVPVTPGYWGDDEAPKRLGKEAEAVGWPVLIKAVAGGGCKGMRRVNSPEDFSDMLASCRREAKAAFGDDRVLIEKYVERPRHIEVQVFGDRSGNIVHLFERDCSLQRRHQKVIEEAPAPGMDAATREAVCAAAVAAARAVAYFGAGTVEFIADASEGLRSDRIWFMEMNTRLQVEHPVTEAITGEDLVDWQLRVAAGENLPKRQDELAISGHAVEARLYAEDPAHDFLPSIGRLDHFELPRDVRADSGVEQGDRIGPWYDPMIAKLVAHANSRGEAIERLAEAMETVEIWPVKTNAAFLARALRDPDFRAGEVDTGFIPARIAALVSDPLPSAGAWNLAATAMLAADFGENERDEEGPWGALRGFRANAPDEARVTFVHGGETRTIAAGGELPLEGMATAADGMVRVFVDGQAFAFTLPGTGSRGGAGEALDGELLSPMPGRVTMVEVKAGASVTRGQKMLTLEAMKMEHVIAAPFDGTLVELGVRAGEQVNEGHLLARIERKED
ncbi:MAG: ATP-binding protein [Sphingosinicella sp.]